MRIIPIGSFFIRIVLGYEYYRELLWSWKRGVVVHLECGKQVR